ncbi:MAG: hypothetical protein ACFFBS_02960 [Promethearchaeota archaeon]
MITINERLSEVDWKFAWLLAMRIQHTLLDLENKRIPSIDELSNLHPDLSPGEIINLQREKWGAEVDWDRRTLSVRFKDRKFDITGEIEKVVKKHLRGTPANRIAMDTHGFDFEAAMREAYDKIVLKIVKGLISPEIVEK